MEVFKSIQFSAPEPGPRLLVLGAVHGNEVCGTAAIQRTIEALEQGWLGLRRGTVTLVPVTNPRAYARGQRQGDRNLNRRLLPTAAPQDFEDRLANWLCPLLAAHEVLLDLHSFQSGSEPFVLVGPRNNQDSVEPFAHEAKELALARALGVDKAVYGWLSTYAAGVRRRQRNHPELPESARCVDYGVGTTEYMRRCGGWGVTLECGQHGDPQSREVAYQAIVRTLTHLGMASAPVAMPSPGRPMAGVQLFEVFDRDDERDQLAANWKSFDAVHKGETIAERADGLIIQATEEVQIVFPNPLAVVGTEWFYLARPSDRFRDGVAQPDGISTSPR